MSGAPHFRERLKSGGTLVAPGVFDAFTARLVELAGFEAAYLGGNALGIHLGVGQSLVTQTEALHIAARVTAAVDIPVILDVGTGYGGPIHVDRTVRDSERVGLAAIHVDDQVDPRLAAYHRGRGEIVATQEAVRRYESAVAARRDSSLAIIARTDVLRVTRSLEDTAARCAAIAAAGVDALLVLDLDPASAAKLRVELPGVPLGWIGGASDPGPSCAEIQAGGFQFALYPFSTIAAICDSVNGLWHHYRDHGTVPLTTDVIQAARTQVLEILDMPRQWQVEDRFL